MGWLAILQLIITILPSLIKLFKEIRGLTAAMPRGRREHYRRRVGALAMMYSKDPDALAKGMRDVRNEATAELKTMMG